MAERFVGWIPGTVADESTAELARSGIGGFIVYPRNMTEREQTITLTSSLQREALKGGNPLGLLFCADQEGGRVTALRMPGFIRLPSARSLALYADEEAVRAAAYLSGIELRSLGITMNLAPVLDLDAGDAGVMTAHIVYEGVDRSYPATLSERFIEDILRERLGYGGLVMTDGLSMGALRDHFGLQETLTLCLRNGIDLILVHDRYDASALIDTALSIYESGAVPAWSLEESLMRIIRLKIRLGLTADAGYRWESAR